MTTLIAVSGRACSGKNTVAEIIRDVLGVDRVKLIAFAEPIKEIVRRVYGWTEKHTDGELKDVGDERYPRDCLWCNARQYRWQCAACHECTDDETPTVRLCPSRGYLTPREAMQTLGTEWGRSCYENTWVDLAMREAKAWIDLAARACEYCGGTGASRARNPAPFAADCVMCRGDGFVRDEAQRLVVITDCRFINEAAAVKKNGGQVWFCNRDEQIGVSDEAKQHQSETEMLTSAFQELVDVQIDNSGSLEDLRDIVSGRLRALGIAS